MRRVYRQKNRRYRALLLVLMLLLSVGIGWQWSRGQAEVTFHTPGEGTEPVETTEPDETQDPSLLLDGAILIGDGEILDSATLLAQPPINVTGTLQSLSINSASVDLSNISLTYGDNLSFTIDADLSGAGLIGNISLSGASTILGNLTCNLNGSTIACTGVVVGIPANPEAFFSLIATDEQQNAINIYVSNTPAVNKRELSIEGSIAAYNQRTYDGTDRVTDSEVVLSDVQVSIADGLLATDAADVAIDRTAMALGLPTKNVLDSGSVMVTGLTLSGTKSDCYKLPDAPISIGLPDGVRLLTPAPLVISLDESKLPSRVYDGTTTVGVRNQIPYLSMGGGVSIGGTQETVRIGISGVSFEDANVKSAKSVIVSVSKINPNGEASLLDTETNYSIQNSFTYAVSGNKLLPRPVVIEIDSLTKTYGSPDPEIECTVSTTSDELNSGLIWGEDIGAVAKPRAGAGDYASGAESVGRIEDAYELDRLDNPNYVVEGDVETADLIIQPIVMSIDHALTTRTASVPLSCEGFASLPVAARPSLHILLYGIAADKTTQSYIANNSIALSDASANVPIVGQARSTQVGSSVISWTSYLPTGAVFRVGAFDPAGNACAMWKTPAQPVPSPSSLEGRATVDTHAYAQPSVSFTLDGSNAENSGSNASSSTRYVKNGATLVVKQDDAAVSKGEYMFIKYTYMKDKDTSKTDTYVTRLSQLSIAMTRTTAETEDIAQSITVGYVDGGISTMKELSVYVADKEQVVPSASIFVKNRDATARIVLPDAGKLLSLTIGGKSYPVGTNAVLEHLVALDWMTDPANLPLAGSQISVSYLDAAGGTASAGALLGRSSGALDVTLSSSGLPANNVIEKVDGAYPKLQLAGTATHFEALTLTIGTYTRKLIVGAGGASAYDATLKTAGNWSTEIDLQSLLDSGIIKTGKAFSITIAYSDIDGKSLTLTATCKKASGSGSGSGSGNGSGGGSGSGSGNEDETDPLDGEDEEIEALGDSDWLIVGEELGDGKLFVYEEYLAYGYLLGVTEPDRAVSAEVGDGEVSGRSDANGYIYLKLPQVSVGQSVMVTITDDEGNEFSREYIAMGIEDGAKLFAYPLGVVFAGEDDDGNEYAYPALPLTPDVRSQGTVNYPLLLGNAIQVGYVQLGFLDGAVSVNVSLNDRSITNISMEDVYCALFDGEPDAEGLHDRSVGSLMPGSWISLDGFAEPWLMFEIRLPSSVLGSVGGLINFDNREDAFTSMYLSM